MKLKKIPSFTLGLLMVIFSHAILAQDKSQTLLNQSLPEFALYDLDGQLVKSESFTGKILVIHIATTWCPFCNAEAPYLEQLHKEYRDKNVRVIVMDVKEPAALIKSRLQQRFNLTFPILLDTAGVVAASFAPQGVLPDLARDEIMLASNILIDSQGKVQFFSLLDSKNFDAKLVDLKAKLNELLASQ